MNTLVKQIGKVKFYNETKGFGFIIMPDGKEAFVHATNLNEPIGMDSEVEFELKDSPRGPKAVNVNTIK